MILANIKWIFFDIGSTLVDESVAYQNRIERTITGTNVTYDDFYNKMVEISKYNQSGYNKALEAYGLKTVPWNSDDEFVYPETENCLSELSKHYKIGIIANQNLGSEERLEKLGLLKHIDLVIASAEEGVAKPDLRIFQIALAQKAAVLLCPIQAPGFRCSASFINLSASIIVGSFILLQ